MAGCPSPSGEWILMAATLAAIQLSQGRTVDELALMSSFFGVLGNDLGFLAITRVEEDEDSASKKDCKTKGNKLD